MSTATPIVHGAIAATAGGRVLLVYNVGLNIYYRESTDDGATFGAETLLIASTGTVRCIAAAYKNAGGDFCVVWGDNVTMKRIRRTGGTVGAAASWSQTAASITGVAMCWNGDYLLVVTGTETTTLRPTLWSLVLGDGFSYTVDTWTAFFKQAQAETDELIVWSAPSVAVLDVPRITFVETFSGDDNYVRTYWTTIAPTASFSPDDWEWLDPVPLDNGTTYGYGIAKGLADTTEVAILARPGQVLTAPTAAVTLDLSGDLIEAVIDERDGLTQRATLVLDNSNGQYAGPPAPIEKHRTVDLGIGYDAEYSSPHSQSITGWRYERSGARSLFVLELAGLDYWLAASRSRSTIVDTRKPTAIARAAAARAGLNFLISGASSRATNLDVDWVVHPHQSQLDILRAVAAILSDVYVSSADYTLIITEPAAADGIDYTYGTDHAIYTSKWRDEARPSFTEVIGPTVLGYAYDFAEQNHDRPLAVRARSPHDTTSANANANAAARMRKAILAVDKGELVTPPNCGLEVNDVIALTDTHIDAAQVKARVRAIRTHFRRRDGAPVLFEQRLALGGL